MSNTFSRSWELTKMSFEVIKQDKEMLLFPLLAGIFSILYLLAMVVPTLFPALAAGKQFDSGSMIIIFAVYLGLAFIATFFNVCVVYTTKVRFAGGNATFSDSIKFAFSKIHLIFSWSLVAATVGLLLRAIDNLAEKSGETGKMVLNIVTSLLGMMWSVITIFVVPSMVYDDLGPIDAIKKSTATLKKTWGESLIRHYGLGLIEFLFIALGAVVTFGLAVLTSGLGGYVTLAIISLGVIYMLAVVLVFTVANSVFNTALYVYADTGKVPDGYAREIMTNAFSRKE